jgi:transcriptional regulator with XRE-family HTH domain
MEVGKVIRSLRTEAGMSQEGLADKVYVSRQTISNWENDKSYPDVQSLALIAGVFGTSIDALVKGDLPMIDARIEEEDARVAEEDVRAFKRNTVMASVLSIVSLVVAGVAFDHANWLALGMCLIVYAVALYFTFLIEGTKKKYDAQTYHEIRAFMDGASLDEIRGRRVQRPLGASVMGKVLAGMCVGAAVGLLMVWLVRLF